MQRLTRANHANVICNESGKIGWVIMWALGIPLPILFLMFFMRGCT